MAKTIFVTCEESGGAYNSVENMYPLDSRFHELEIGTRVTLKVRLPYSKQFKLVQGVVMSSIDDCTCGECDYVVTRVVVPKAMVEEHLEEESTKLSFEKWRARRYR